MWLSRSLALRRTAGQEETAADMGVTTIGGQNAAVFARGEQRDLEVFAPGGLVWQPRAGDTVLVIGGTGGQERCIVAADTTPAAPTDMAPGELFLYSAGGASIYLRADGGIAVKGPMSVTGKLTVAGGLEVTGDVAISGSLTIDGTPYQPHAQD